MTPRRNAAHRHADPFHQSPRRRGARPGAGQRPATAWGSDAVLFAPGARPFFRQSRGKSVVVPVTPVNGGLREQVRRRIDDYVAWFRRPGAGEIRHLPRPGRHKRQRPRRPDRRRRHSRLCAHRPPPRRFRRRAAGPMGSALDPARPVRCCASATSGETPCASATAYTARIVGNGVDRERFTPRPDGTRTRCAPNAGADGRAGVPERGRRRSAQERARRAEGLPGNAAAPSWRPTGDRRAARPCSITAPIRRRSARPWRPAAHRPGRAEASSWPGPSRTTRCPLCIARPTRCCSRR